MGRRRKRRGKGGSGEPRMTGGNLEGDERGSSARCDDVGPSNEVREPGLELPEPCYEDTKHKIFLSHSGAQKDFTWQLCEELERVHHFPFFDRREDSLPKGEKFPALIVEAARRCRVAVVVLSEEFFTKSKWPMIELNEFVKAQESANQGLKLLPLFLGITMKEYADEERQRRWLDKWNGFASEDVRIKVEEWKHAVSKIPGGINAMEYGGVGEGEVEFRKKVVEAVCKLLPPDVKYDVSDIESMDRLCEPIVRMMEVVTPASGCNARVVGLHGMGGVGKTTITRAICNKMYGDFGGKVCHVELGGTNLVELLKRVLGELTEASPAILGNEHKKLADLLKNRMRRQKVCLIVDNVWEDQIEEAMMYLDAGYGEGSVVVVTARSREVLVERLRIPGCNCMEMPNLEQEGAIGVFLKNAGRSRECIESDDEWKVIKGCVAECCFVEEKSRENDVQNHGYHPLALKVLGSQLGGMGGEISRWVECLKEPGADKFNMWKDKVHPIFCVLGIGYLALGQEEQELFLDLAVLVLSKRKSGCSDGAWNGFKWEVLCMILGKRDAEMKASVKALQRKGLVEKGEDVGGLDCKIHDLYVEFAVKQVEGEAFERRRFLIDRDGMDVPREFTECPPRGNYWSTLKRVIICGSKVKTLKSSGLHLLKNVEVLDVNNCEELEVIDVTGMENLRCIVVFRCPRLKEWVGVEKLRNLVMFYCLLDERFYGTMRSTLTLDKSSLDLSGCTNLREVTLTETWSFRWSCDDGLRTCGDFSKYLPKSLTKIDFGICSYNLGRSPISSMRLLTNLQDLDLDGCKEIEDLTGVGELISLRSLNVGGTGISVLPSGLGNLQHLEILDVSECKVTSIGVIARATSLRIVNASYCHGLRELPDDLSKLEKLERIDLGGSRGLCSLPRYYERLGGYCGSRGILGVDVRGCIGLVSPLLERLRGPKTRGENCVDECVCGDVSMQSWMDGRSIDVGAYDLLKSVFEVSIAQSRCIMDSDRGTSNSHEVAWEDIVIRALCEHYNRWRETHEKPTSMSCPRFSDVGVWIFIHSLLYMVGTAPCTFRAIMEMGVLHPWSRYYPLFTWFQRYLPAQPGDLIYTWNFILYWGVNEKDYWGRRVEGMEATEVKFLEDGGYAGESPIAVEDEAMEEFLQMLRVWAYDLDYWPDW